MYNNTELCVKTDKDTMTENFTSNIVVGQEIILFGDPILCSNYTIYQYTSASRQLFLTLILDHLHIISSSILKYLK
jgi:hypothetical protein